MPKFLTRLLNSSLGLFLIVAVAYMIFIVSRLSFHGFDPSYFVTAGDRFCDPKLVPKNLSVLENSYGYDGEFYYRLALDPFTSKVTDFGISFDSPAYRHQRIFYPFLVWLFSLGYSSVVPLLMILVNYAALCLIGWMGFIYAREMRQSVGWGILFFLWPGFLMVLSRSTTEIVEICLLMASLLFLRRRKSLLATGFLTLAVLTRETALVVAAAGMLTYFWNKKDIKWYYFTVPFLVYCLWQTLLFLNWKRFPFLAGSQGLDWPFAGLINAAIHPELYIKMNLSLWIAEVYFILAYLAAGLVAIRKTKALIHEKIVWFLYAVLVVSLSTIFWVEDGGFLRALSELHLLSVIILVGSSSKAKSAILCGMAFLWIVLFLNRMG